MPSFDPLSSEEKSKYAERTERILDAASELIQRFGYKKTTIDDIARQAAVAKGTIYLHWKTKDELFIALIMREKVREGRKITIEMADDPDGGTLHAILKYSVLSGLRNPLIKAALLSDSEVLGSLTKNQFGRTSSEEQIQAFYQLIAYFRAQGLIRTDLSIQAQVYMLMAISTGFLTVDQFLPEAFQVSIEEKAQIISESIKRAFALRTPTPEEQQETINKLHHMFDEIEEYTHKEQ